MQVLIELDAETHQRLEKVAPAKSRKRSAFIRGAIQKALWDLEEDRTRWAYLKAPDDEPPAFDPGTWAPRRYGGFEAPASERSATSRSKRRRNGRAAKNAAGKAGKSGSKKAIRARKRS